MHDLFIDETIKTPKIFFSPQAKKFEISGRSIPENSIEFYKPVFNWLASYIKSPLEDTTLNIKLEYFNTSSSKCIVEILKKFELLIKKEKRVTINWYYEEDDEDMLESGKDFKNVTKIDMNTIMV